MKLDEELFKIFFQSMGVMLALTPPLVYSFGKSLLDKLKNVQNHNGIKGYDYNAHQDIVHFYFATDQTVFMWTIYIIWCLISIIIYLFYPDSSISRGFALMWWIIFLIFTSIVSFISLLESERSERWKSKVFYKDRLAWIGLLFFYSFAEFLFIEYNYFMNKGIGAVILTMLIFLFFYYFIWFIAALIYLPISNMIKLKGL